MHLVNTPIMANEDDDEDIYEEGSFDEGANDLDGDREDEGMFDLDGDGEEDVNEVNGEEDANDDEDVVDGQGVEDAAILKEFEGSIGEEQLVLYHDNNVRDDEARERENVMAWFEAASLVTRDTEEAPRCLVMKYRV